MKLPCDECIWGLIPMIKREIVLKMHELGLSNVKIAGKLNVTKGAVTQYIQGKRAKDSSQLRKIKVVNSKIEEFACQIAKKDMDNRSLASGFCLICKLAQKKTGIV